MSICISNKSAEFFASISLSLISIVCASEFPGIHRKTSVSESLLFYNKVAGLRPAKLFKKRLFHRRFSVIFAKFPRLLTVNEIKHG